MIRFGYAAQNLTIPATTNRSVRLANLCDAERARDLVRANLASLRTIVEWNANFGIGLFRIGQSLIPFGSHPAFPYDWRQEHGGELAAAGDLARTLGIRLSMHPGQYIQPASPTPGVVERSVAELRYVTTVMNAIGSDDSVIVLHLGGGYCDKATTASRFVEVMSSEAETLRYLALENDERIWTAAEVSAVAGALGVPAITDTLHHRLNPGEQSLTEAIDTSLPTWVARGVRPKVHLSTQDPLKQTGAHAFGIDPADWRELEIALDGREADVMVEAKGKERALIPLGFSFS